MSALTTAEMLKYANLQMAAEALYDFNTKKRDPASLVPGEHYVGPIQSNWLTDGNEHASRFAPTEATKFAAQWTVVDHISNTTTGFSGTLLKNKTTNELVISFRSTEFVDDAARDSMATNNMEIATYGFAFGQIADMEAWYKSLNDKGLLPAGSQYSITGYSLGGHLATAFNLLRHEDGTAGRVGEVVTFNGAGVGQVTAPSGKLGDVMQTFTTLRDSKTQLAMQFQDTRLGALYTTLSDRLKNGDAPTSADYALLDTVTSSGLDETAAARFDREKNYLRSALDRIVGLKNEVQRLEGVTDSKDGHPAQIPDSAIAQESFDYQMAVIWSSESTRAMSKISGGFNTVFGKTPGAPFLDNQYDVVGRETTTTQTAMVADSQWHHGTNVDLFIEDQPLFRGNGSELAINDILKKGTLNLNSEYSNSNFGDTHSLVLIVDSLNVQNTLLNLLPEQDRSLATNPQSTLGKALQNILRDASWYKAESQSGTQGKAEQPKGSASIDFLAH